MTASVRPRTLAAVTVACAIIAALGTTFACIGIAHRAPSAYFASAGWGILLLASFTGWGSALNRAAFPRDRADWGLRCAWGWAVAVVIGGALCSVRLAYGGVLIAVAGIGLALLGFDLVRRARRRRSARRRLLIASSRIPFAVGVVGIAAMALVEYFSTIVNGDFNGNDDQNCYFGFVREILERGTLTQPFSFRRISVYGGQSLLQAFQLAIPVPDIHIHLLDNGMALMSVLFLLVGQAKVTPRASRAVILLLLLLTITMPEVRINVSATQTGALFFLGLYRTLTWGPVARHEGLRGGLPVALLSAGACTLRQNYLAPVGILLALEYGRPIVESIRWRPFLAQREPIIRAAVTAGALFLFLVPWWAMSQRWCGSFLFPIIRGNYSEDYDYFRPLKAFDELRYIWLNVCYCLPVKAVPLFLVAGLIAVDHRRCATLVNFLVAVFAGFAMLVKAYPDIDAPNLGRYYFGFTFAGLVAIALAVANSSGRRVAPTVSAGDMSSGLPLILIGIALQLYSDHDVMRKHWIDYIGMNEPHFHGKELDEGWKPRTQDPEYARIQAAIPAGAPVATLVDQYFQFDLRRNRVASLDMIGAISPPPGLPLFGTPDDVADYLVAQGYRYLVVVHPDAADQLYRRDHWRRIQSDSGTLEIWRRTAKFYLRAFDIFDELRETRVHIAETSKMTALDLTSRGQ